MNIDINKKQIKETITAIRYAELLLQCRKEKTNKLNNSDTTETTKELNLHFLSIGIKELTELKNFYKNIIKEIN